MLYKQADTFIGIVYAFTRFHFRGISVEKLSGVSMIADKLLNLRL
jgi:hypothetical protein